ncbi:MAG: RNA polymerase sigma factor [Planctomycetota bacterium]|jgi:RNA polymerase sigma-70 factor (ECF subfamily)
MVEKAMESRNADHHARVVDEDAVLLVRAGRGDRAAFDRLYHKYYRVVTSYLARRNGCHDMLEDLVQEVFTRLWQNRKQFRGDSSVRTYVLGIAAHALSDYKRLLSKQRAHGYGTLEKYRPVYLCRWPAPDTKIYFAEIKEALKRAVLELTARQREAITLFYSERLSSQKAMANRADCSVEAFRSRLREAHKRLHQGLCNKGFEDCGL